MAEPTERTPMPPQKRAQAKTDPAPPAEPEETAERRTAGEQANSGTPVPIPGGVDRGFTVEQIQVRRRAPALSAVRYDGSNAVQVGAWVLGQNRAGCRVDFRQGKLPVLLSEDGTPVARGWVLPNLEVLSEQDLTTIYERIETA